MPDEGTSQAYADAVDGGLSDLPLPTDFGTIYADQGSNATGDGSDQTSDPWGIISGGGSGTSVLAWILVAAALAAAYVLVKER